MRRIRPIWHSGSRIIFRTSSCWTGRNWPRKPATSARPTLFFWGQFPSVLI